ncbi:MAG: tRNA (guanosine(37)-N1)-methyltransferase TrmD [Firmicutes bacterium]|nr:tRNA (guanosine(37)-N1)-methyltransferase TrmD [Bacillota bacterium]
MRMDIVTIFPDMFKSPFAESIVKRALEKGLVELNIVDLRRYTHDKHRQVDDAPYGGGPGMVMKPEPFFEAVEDLKNPSLKTVVVLLSPAGEVFNQRMARSFLAYEQIIILCGRYEGVDERVHQHLADKIVSIGDYVLTGGELPAMVLTDALIRLIPGVITADSTAEESFAEGLLEYPHYTRPASYRGMDVPAVLLSGDHKRIAAWRKEQALKRTLKYRPDLLEDNGSGVLD